MTKPLFYKSTQTNIILIIISVSMALVIVACVLLFKLKKKRDLIVIKTSPYIANIKEINSRYNFEKIYNSVESRTYHLKTKRQFDNFDYYKKVVEYVKSNLDYYQVLYYKIDFNLLLLPKYKEELAKIHTTGDESLAKANNMSLRTYVKREIKFGRKLIFNPTTTYRLRIYFEYTSPAGRNHYSHYSDANTQDIREIVEKLSSTKKSRNRVTECQQKQRDYEILTAHEKIYTNDDIESVE